MSQQNLVQMSRAQSGYQPGEYCYRYSCKTQIMAATLAANSIVWAIKPFTGRMMFIERLALQWTTLTAFTTPVTAGRGLALRNAQGTATGGALIQGFEKTSTPTSPLICRVATTTGLGGLVLSGIADCANLSLAGYGASGANILREFDFSQSNNAAVGQNPTDDSFVIYNPQAMDAAGTWELIVEADICMLPEGFPE